MAIIDRLIQFSDNQAVTADAASTDTIDVTAQSDIGVGEPLYFVVQVSSDELDDTTGNETYSVQLQEADDTNFSGSDLKTVATVTFTRGATKGTQMVAYVPYGVSGRHIRAWYDVGGTTPTGSFHAYITCEPPRAWQAYPAVL